MKRAHRMLAVGVLVLAAVAALSAAPKPLSFAKFPYLQAVSYSEITVMWETNIPASASVTVSPTSNPARRISRRVTDPRKIHRVRVAGLSPGEEYAYAVVSWIGDSRVEGSGRFRTLPKSGPFQFAAYGDNRTNSEDHRKVVQAMLRDPDARPLFVVHTGDLVTSGDIYDQWGKEFFEPASGLLKNVPIFPVLGNHERDSDWYYAFFALPGSQRWYSVQVSNVVVIALDVMFSPFSPDQPQYWWLESELKRAQSEGKMPIVFFHSQVYSSGSHAKHDDKGVPEEKPARGVQQYLVPLFETYRVRLVLSGHDHFYERSERNGILYVVTGGGGAGLRDKDKDVSNPYSKVFHQLHHYLLVNIDGDKILVKAKDADGKVIDSFSISAR